MVPKTKNQNRVVETPLCKAPVTLGDLYNLESERHRRSALRRLETILGASLGSMPADIEWFDASLPRHGVCGRDVHWVSEQAYRHWRSTVRCTIRQHLVALGTSIRQVRPVQLRHGSIASERHRIPGTADLLVRHADLYRAIAHYADFRKTPSDPKSD